MPTNTTNQQITLPIGTDTADNPLAFLDQVADYEGRLVQRYTNLADRTARNPAPTLNEMSILGTATWYDRYTGVKWIPVTAIKARMAATQSVLNSTAFVDAAGLFTPLPVANTSFAFEACLFYDGSATSDIKFNFTIPAGATTRFSGAGLSTGSATATGDGNYASAAAGVAYGAIGAGSVLGVYMYGQVDVVGTTGNLQVQFAQNALDAAVPARLIAGSWLSTEAIV